MRATGVEPVPMPLTPNLIADSVNPATAFLMLAAPLVTPRPVRAPEYWVRCFLGIGLAVVLAESGKRWEVWPGHRGFPSGHETFCLAAVTCLAVRDARWLALGLPLSALMAWALVAAQYHTPVDVAGALLTGPAPALLCQLYRARSGRA